MWLLPPTLASAWQPLFTAQTEEGLHGRDGPSRSSVQGPEGRLLLSSGLHLSPHDSRVNHLPSHNHTPTSVFQTGKQKGRQLVMTENICLQPTLGTDRHVRKSRSAALAWQLSWLPFSCPSSSINPYLPTGYKHYPGSENKPWGIS